MEPESTSTLQHVHVILQGRILEWVTMPFSRASSQPRDWSLLTLLHWHVSSLLLAPPGKPSEEVRLPKSLELFFKSQTSKSEQHFLIKKKKKKISFLYLAVLGLSWGVQNLVPQPGTEPEGPALGVQSLSHWTTREVPMSEQCFPSRLWSPDAFLA